MTYLLWRKERLVIHHASRSYIKREARISDGHYIVLTSQERCAVCQKTLKGMLLVQKTYSSNLFPNIPWTLEMDM